MRFMLPPHLAITQHKRPEWWSLTWRRVSPGGSSPSIHGGLAGVMKCPGIRKRLFVCANVSARVRHGCLGKQKIRGMTFGTGCAVLVGSLTVRSHQHNKKPAKPGGFLLSQRTNKYQLNAHILLGQV